MIFSHFSIKESNVLLQKAILSASFVKQVWFLYEATEKYLDILDALNSFEPDKEIKLEHFQMPQHYFEKLNCSCDFAPIVIQSSVTKVTITEVCLHVLSQVVSLVDDSTNQRLRERSAKIVMSTLVNGSLDEKTLCVMFFGQFLKLCTVFTLNLEHLVLEVLSVAETTLERFNRWLSSEIVRLRSLEQFKTALVDFYSKLNALKYDRNPSELKQKLFQCSMKIIKNVMTIKKDAEDLKLKLLEEISKFMKAVQNQFGVNMVNDIYDDVFTLSCQFPDLLNLLEIPITSELITNKDLGDSLTLQRSHFWNRALDIIQEEDNSSNKMQRIYLCQKIVHLAANVLYNFTCWLQKESNKTTYLLAFGGDFQSFLNTIFQVLSEINFTSDIVLLLLDVCFDATLLKDFGSLDVDFQKQICEWLLLPFANDSKSADHKEIPNNLKKKYYDLLKSGCDVNTLKTRSLDQLCALSLTNISDSVAEGLKNSLWDITQSIVRSEDLAQKRMLHRFYVNILLSFKYKPSQLVNEILNPSLTVPELRPIAIQNLALHFCMKSASFSVFEIRRDCTIRRKIRCFRCKPSANEQDITSTQTSPSQKQELFAQSDGIRLTIDNLDEYALFELSGDTLETLYQSEDSDTQVEMVKLLPILLKHNAELVTSERLIKAWSHLITCNSGDASITFSKTFPILMDYVTVSFLKLFIIQYSVKTDFSYYNAFF